MLYIQDSSDPPRLYLLTHRRGRRRGHPFPGLHPVLLDTAPALLYGLLLLAYSLGFLTGFGRSIPHDAALAIGFVAALVATSHWPAVVRLPRVGRLLYLLPGFALAASPFAAVLCLIFSR